MNSSIWGIQPMVVLSQANFLCDDIWYLINGHSFNFQYLAEFLYPENMNIEPNFDHCHRVEKLRMVSLETISHCCLNFCAILIKHLVECPFRMLVPIRANLHRRIVSVLLTSGLNNAFKKLSMIYFSFVTFTSSFRLHKLCGLTEEVMNLAGLLQMEL